MQPSTRSGGGVKRDRNKEATFGPLTEMNDKEDASGVAKHSLVIAGHRTSISLERAFWDALGEIAAAEGVSRAALVAKVDAERGNANLSSALRVYVLERVSNRAAAGVHSAPRG